jgi:hypothetical protein
LDSGTNEDYQVEPDVLLEGSMPDPMYYHKRRDPNRERTGKAEDCQRDAFKK